MYALSFDELMRELERQAPELTNMIRAGFDDTITEFTEEHEVELHELQDERDALELQKIRDRSRPR